jgi:hypothetical protein
MEPIIVSVAFFMGVVAIWGSFIFTRHKERVMMIDRGLKSDEIKSLYSRPGGPINPMNSLKWGILFVSVGIAILVSIWLRETYLVSEGVFPGLITLAGGIGLLTFYLIVRKKGAS